MEFPKEQIWWNAAYVFAFLVVTTAFLAGAVFLIRAWMVRSKPTDRNEHGTQLQELSSGKQIEQFEIAESEETRNYASLWFEGNKGHPRNVPLVRSVHHSPIPPAISGGGGRNLHLSVHKRSQPSGARNSLDSNPATICVKKSPPNYINVIPSTLSPDHTRRKRYAPSELMALQQRLPSHSDEGPVLLSSLLRYDVVLPLVIVTSPEEAEARIAECGHFLREQDSVSRVLGLLQLVSLGASEFIYGNPTHFLESFCRQLVHVSRAIAGFDNLREELVDPMVGVKTLRVELLELLLSFVASFCWEHWHLEHIIQSLEGGIGFSSATLGMETFKLSYQGFFLRWDLRPFKVNRPTIFGLFCRFLEAGHVVQPQSSACRRLATLFIECAANTKCLEYRELFPVVAHGITSSDRGSTVAFFYDILTEITSRHLVCCLSAHDVFSLDSVLQAIIRYGLESTQNDRVRHKVANLCQIIGDRFAEVSLWADSSNIGNPSHEELASPLAPGAWRSYLQNTHASFGG